MPRDITDRKQIEETLRESEEKYRSLLEHAYDAIMIADFEGNLLEINQKAEQLLGYSKEELIGTNISRIHPEEELARILPAFREMVEGKTHTLFDTKVLQKDGKTIPVDISGGAITYGGRQVAHAIFRDITDHKKTEKQLKDYQERLEKLVKERTNQLNESEEKFKNIFEDAVVGIYQSIPEGRFLMVNLALAQMYGYKSPKELMRSVTNIATDIYVDPEQRKDFIALAERDGIVRNFEIQVRTRDGFTKYVSANAHTVKDGNGKVLYYEGIVQDVTEKRLALALVTLQRDLALKLARVHSFAEGLAVILQAAITASGVECGGISLKNSETGRFDLVHSVGLTKNFQKKIQHILVGSFTWSQMMEKKSFHVHPNKKSTPIAFQEGFRFISVMPILQADDAIGFLVVASKVLTEIPEQVRMGLEVLAAESGNIIARIQAREQLEREILARREAQESLEAEHRDLGEAHTALQEANTALKVLLKHREEDKKELEEKFLSNVQRLVMPYVEKLKKSNLDPVQQMSIDIVESNLKEITSSFLKGIQNFRFTPRQLEVSILIREGKTTKDIAGLLHVSRYAVDLLRFQIRKKLGLNKEKTNLQSYLKSLR
jgi:PAS domain S-box-containing protein